MAAVPAATLYGSASSEKPGVGAVGANHQSNSLRALGAVALVGGFIAVDVDVRIHVATRKLDAHKATCRRCSAIGLVAFGQTIRQIKIFANHCRYTV